MHWKCPFVVVEKVSDMDFRIDIGHKTKTIKDGTRPHTKTQLRSLVGFHYLKRLQRQNLLELFDKKKKKKKKKMTFNTLKARSKLTQKPILHLPDIKPFIFEN